MAAPEPGSPWAGWGALALGLLFWGLVVAVFKVNGTPGGYGFFEVVILPIGVGGWFVWRGVSLLWKAWKG